MPRQKKLNYYGIGKVPHGKKQATRIESLKNKQVRRWGEYGINPKTFDKYSKNISTHLKNINSHVMKKNPKNSQEAKNIVKKMGKIIVVDEHPKHQFLKMRVNVADEFLKLIELADLEELRNVENVYEPEFYENSEEYEDNDEFVLEGDFDELEDINEFEDIDELENIEELGDIKVEDIERSINSGLNIHYPLIKTLDNDERFDITKYALENDYEIQIMDEQEELEFGELYKKFEEDEPELDFIDIASNILADYGIKYNLVKKT